MSAAKGHLSMLTANTIWGMMAPLAKYVMAAGVVTPFVLTDLRIFGAAVLFWIASLFKKQERVPVRDLAKLFVASMLAIVFNQGSYISGVGLTSPMDASIITTSMPLWAMLIAAVFLKEPISARKVGGIVAGAAGALLLITGSHRAAEASAGDNAMLGNVLVLTAQLSYAFYLVLFKNFVTRYSIVTIMKWMFTFASVVMLPLTFSDLNATQWSDVESRHIASIAFIVVGATFVSYILVVVGQRLLRPTVAGMYNYVQPVVASIIAIAWGMDSFSLVKLAAVILIFGGVFLVSTSKSRESVQKCADKY